MAQSISRRQFLLSLVPPWATKHNLLVGAIGAAVTLAAVVVVSIVREVGVLRVAQMAAVGALIALAWWLLKRLFRLIISLIERAPPFVRALIAVLGEAFGTALVMAMGVYLYERWKQGADLTSFAFTLAILVASRTWDEWQKRKQATGENSRADDSSAHV